MLDPRRGGNGIVIVQQKRGRGNMPRSNSIHDNDITLAGGDGAIAGWFADFKPNKFASSNKFDNNHYHVYAPDGSFWAPRRVDELCRLAGDRPGHARDAGRDAGALGDTA